MLAESMTMIEPRSWQERVVCADERQSFLHARKRRSKLIPEHVRSTPENSSYRVHEAHQCTPMICAVVAHAKFTHSIAEPPLAVQLASSNQPTSRQGENGIALTLW